MTQATIGISGGVVFWSLGGATNFDTLLAKWTALGHEKSAPDRISPLDATKAALADLYGNRDQEINRAKRRAGYVVHRRKAGLLDDTDFDERVKVYVDPGPTPGTYRMTVGGPDADEARIRTAVDAQLGILPPSKVTAGLVAIVRSYGGVPLRETGGIYWIPEHNMAAWEQVARATEQSGSGNQIYAARTVLDDEGKRAVLAAIRSDINAAVEKMTQEVMEGGMTSERALKHRREQIQQMESRVAEYESALGIALDDIRAGLDSITRAIVHLTGMEMGAAMGSAGLGGEFAGMGNIMATQDGDS
jgi:hypothetical protein